MSGSRKSEQEHVPHFLHKTWTESFWTFHVVVMQIKGKEMYLKSVLQLDLLLFFTIMGIQRVFSVKYLFGEANFAFISLGKKFLDDHSTHVQFSKLI